MPAACRHITAEAIRTAKELLAPHLPITPLYPAAFLSELLNAEVLLKLENFQPSGTFRDRGLLHALLNLDKRSRKEGVLVAPNTNSAFAAARHGANLEIPVSVVLPITTPLQRVHSIHAFGADVILQGSDINEALQEAEKIAQARGIPFLHPSEDRQVITGYGSIGFEISDQLQSEPVDILLCPVTTGALISAVAVAFKSIYPDTKIIGVEPQHSSRVFAFFKGSHHHKTGYVYDPTLLQDDQLDTLCSIAKETIPTHVDDLVTVTDESLNMAILHLLEQGKMLSEIPAAASVAALLEHRQRFVGKRLVAILTSGNIDINLLSRIIDRGLLKSGRLSRLKILLSDRPGALEQLAHLCAQHRANILQVNHDRIFSRTPIGSAQCHLTVETRGPDHVSQLMIALEEQGFSFTVAP